jgi:hypothetical protein
MTSLRESSVTIVIGSGQYHFVTEDGWRESWVTETAREWWEKHLWQKAGGHKQDATSVQTKVVRKVSGHTMQFVS